jgi:hypothetical protein
VEEFKIIFPEVQLGWSVVVLRVRVLWHLLFLKSVTVFLRSKTDDLRSFAMCVPLKEKFWSFGSDLWVVKQNSVMFDGHSVNASVFEVQIVSSTAF